jgi:hypothetical protein
MLENPVFRAAGAPFRVPAIRRGAAPGGPGSRAEGIRHRDRDLRVQAGLQSQNGCDRADRGAAAARLAERILLGGRNKALRWSSSCRRAVTYRSFARCRSGRARKTTVCPTFHGTSKPRACHDRRRLVWISILSVSAAASAPRSGWIDSMQSHLVTDHVSWPQTGFDEQRFSRRHPIWVPSLDELAGFRCKSEL